MERKIKKALFTLITMAAVFMAAPVSAGAKADNSLAVTAPAKQNVKIKKVKAGRYRMSLKAGTKNIPLTVKAKKAKVTAKCRWKVSNKKVVSVTRKGRLTAKKAGRARITATYKGRKAVLDVMVAKAAKKPNGNKVPDKTPDNTPKEPDICRHNWEKHWNTAVFEDTVERDGFMALCNCGAFYSEEEYNSHMALNFGYGSVGIHGGEAKSKCDVNEIFEPTEDGIKTTTHYRIETTYIEYMECTLCGEKVTGH